MKDLGIFPFGNPVQSVLQQDRCPKQIFVLEVYASAVHAVWFGSDGKRRVKALAVASEPEIFWRGDGADAIIDSIRVPKELGHLAPTAKHLNGPSGRSLDAEYLEPLGMTRDDAWLSDI